MKVLTCDLCDYEAQGNTFEEWMQALHPHYVEKHADVMSNAAHTEEDMKRWMQDNKKRFDAQEELA